MYGIINYAQAIDFSKEVVRVLGGGENAVKLLLESGMKETKLGNYRDKYPYGAGVGVTQFDLIGFMDTQARTPESRKDAIKEAWGIDIDQVAHRELAYSPFLCFLFTRLFYLLRPGVIPNTIGGRAKYWKKHYNTEKGKGTIKQYMQDASELYKAINISDVYL